MERTFEEIKSLIAVGGLVAVGYTIGLIIAICYNSSSLIAPGVGALIGASVAIILTLRKLWSIIK
jgi:hypothetical protein